ncbi:hypothetical protein QQP08_008835 [Theobroma cacao]|nr:hypothetical protein QQP08_008835 [Theobroma cacao]
MGYQQQYVGSRTHFHLLMRVRGVADQQLHFGSHQYSSLTLSSCWRKESSFTHDLHSSRHEKMVVMKSPHWQAEQISSSRSRLPTLIPKIHPSRSGMSGGTSGEIMTPKKRNQPIKKKKKVRPEGEEVGDGSIKR